MCHLINHIIDVISNPLNHRDYIDDVIRDLRADICNEAKVAIKEVYYKRFGEQSPLQHN
jgi:hypothetical protein